ncbi:MAG TPA: prenyltransferase/squalene oxidase repeat-containing protein, partial [Rhizomicrobium sp.]
MNQLNPGDFVEVEGAVRAATAAILAQQKPDGHWVYELEADATIPAEYVLLVHYLAETPNLELERKIGVYLRRIQGAHGGWPLYHEGAFDISATVKAYFALKMIGDDIDAPHMARARAAIRERGGAIKANVFTRILLCLYGECSWNDVPTVPPELILLPRWFPVHLSKMSYWARTVIVPLLVLCAMKPLAR